MCTDTHKHSTTVKADGRYQQKRLSDLLSGSYCRWSVQTGWCLRSPAWRSPACAGWRTRPVTQIPPMNLFLSVRPSEKLSHSLRLALLHLDVARRQKTRYLDERGFPQAERDVDLAAGRLGDGAAERRALEVLTALRSQSDAHREGGVYRARRQRDLICSV